MEVWYFFLFTAAVVFLLGEALGLDNKYRHPIRLVAILFFMTSLFLMYSVESGVVKNVAEMWLYITSFLWMGYLAWYLVAFWLRDLLDWISRVI